MTSPILYDTHMHTPLCKHARGEPEAYAAHAEKRGLKGIIFACHAPLPNGRSKHLRMEITQFEKYVELVDRARQAWQGRVDVRLGLESDYYPGVERWLEEVHGKADLQHIIGSVHPDHPEYKNQYYRGDAVSFYQTYYDHLARSAETGLFDTLGHPDVVKHLFPQKWDVTLIMDDVRHALDRIAKTGVAMELNTSGLTKTVKEMSPGRLILEAMLTRGIPVVVNSDAHDPHRVAADFEAAFDLLLEVGYTETNFFLQRQRQTVEIAAAKASLIR